MLNYYFESEVRIVKFSQFIVTIFWALVLGQMAGFIASALTETKFDSPLVAGVSVVFALIFFILAGILERSANTSTTSDKKKDN